MSDLRADVALLVDFTDLRQSLCPDAAAADAPAPVAEAPGAAPAHPPAREVARHLVRFASRLGRLALARAYADWSRCSDLAREIHDEGLDPVLVPATRDGEDRSHIRLVVDALEALYTGDEPDAFVLVTGDPTLLPLVQKLKADGSEVIVVAAAANVAEELRAVADRFVALEDALAGAESPAVRPRPWRGMRMAGGPAEDGGRPRSNVGRASAEPRRERPTHPTPVRSDQDFEGYDWAPFIRLIDELEHRLPFVGVRYLVNKVLGGHNAGVEDPRLKRDLINRAVEDEVIEMYPVGNLGDRADPVTACRLHRQGARVTAVIGPTTTPTPPPEHGPEETYAASDLNDHM